MHQTYRHSGRFTLLGVIVALLAGCIVGILVGYLYAWGIPRIPEAKLACIATMAFGAGVGAATAMVMIGLKVRNTKVAALTGLGSATVAWYCSWAFWVANVLHQFVHKEVSSFLLMQRPGVLWILAKMINQNGTWGMSENSPTNGTELWIIWFLEAVVVLGLAAVTSAGLVNRKPFCESCNRWCSAAEKLCLSPVEDVRQFKQQLEVHDLSFLAKLAAGSVKATHLQAQLYSCPGCGELNTLTVKQIFIQPRKFGSPAVKEVMLADKLLVSRQEADGFREAARRLNQAPKAKAAHA